MEYCDDARRSQAALWKRSLKTITPNVEFAHSPHLLEAAPWKCSREPIAVDLKSCDDAHRSQAGLWKRSLKTITPNEEFAHSPHLVEASP
eukprot:6490536-Amphidinium_carterae.1